MAMNIKNDEVERLAAEVASLARETKTEAIRRALLERKARLTIRRGTMSRRDRLETFLRKRVWPTIPEEARRSRLTKKERESILGYGPEGF